MHRMTPNWSWTLNSQKYSIYTKYLPLRYKFLSVSLYALPFPRYKVVNMVKNWKCTEWPQTELEHLTAKSTLCTVNTYPWGPNFGPFCSTASGFEDIAHFNHSPLTTMLNGQKKNKKNCQKSKIWNFTILLTTLLETLPRSIHEF